MALIPFLVDIFDNPLLSLSAVIGASIIGIFQGWILGIAMLQRFPKLQNHVKTVSISLFVLFLMNAILSVPRFASPEKIDFVTLSAKNPNEFASFLFLIFGTNTGFLTVLAFSVTVMTFVLLKFTSICRITKAFILFSSAFLLIFTCLSRFTDLTPSAIEVLLYFLYQLGITIGIFAGTIRKLKLKAK